MKKLKLSILIALLLVALIVIAQTVKQDVNSSVGNSKAMEYNLNEPNAVNPAKDNIQKYEKEGVVLDKNNHPQTDLSNNYNRNSFESIKK